MIPLEEIKKLIPHRFPFLMIDRIVECQDGDYVKAIKCISYDEKVFEGHFPGHPIFPGVLVIESLAQTSCVLFSRTIKPKEGSHFYITNIRMRFLNPVHPGDVLQLFSKSVKIVKTGAIFSIEAKVNDNIVATGEMVFACKQKEE